MSSPDILYASPWAILPTMSQVLAQMCRGISTSASKDCIREGLRALPVVATNFLPAGQGNNGQMAVLPIRGIILPYASALASFLGATCLDSLTEAFCEARDNPDVKAIVLDIDSPGGMVTGVHAFSQLVFAARSTKPIIAKVSGMAASAAYWIAASSSQIILDPTSLLGSIGVVTRYTDTSEKEKKEGRSTTQIISSQSPYKGLDATTEAGRAHLQAEVDQLAAVFVEAVALYRAVPVSTVLSDFGQGGLLVGAAAVAQGLADSLATLSPTFFTPTTGVSLMTSLASPTPPPILAAETDLPEEVFKKVAEQPPSEGSYAQGFDAGLQQGQSRERQRIEGIEAQSLPGHEALIQALKYDGVSTGSDAALQILASEKRQRLQFAANLKEEAPAPLPPLMETPSAGSRSLAAQSEAEWEASAQVQAEFHSLAAYTAYRRAERNGRIQGGNKPQERLPC